ncbi:MAG TPA: FecR domain-containing protein [Niabella sp.]|nr:FecR domain-containing protein [Niabella sp.]HOZ97713.1 FecR domain-containing protein [Niabella sp.]HQW14019.1 FecR domain-containing protein [Niabella sp.]HQX19438.1 FecR domain-containing protein [Niabella sp.]HQX40209.1 FecR domain-containing protein [Niabella sp.]
MEKRLSDFENFSTADFITEPLFQDWVILPDAAKNFFWSSFLETYPNKKQEVTEAITILETIRLAKADWPDSEKVNQSLKVALQKIESDNIKKSEGKIIRVQKYWWVAASVLVAVALSAYFLVQDKKTGKKLAITQQEQPAINDIAPGGNKAILTLADGTQVVLDSANNGAISNQGNVTVIKLNDGQLAYNAAGNSASVATIQYNTIATPRGGQYQLVLMDGTKVWLNSSSSLKFPTTFGGTERKVELTGEGYFEVAKDKTKPFYVSTGSMNIKVLGTHFNVSAYSDEDAFKTTLLEGAVEVNASGQIAKLNPGQQAKLHTSGARLQTINNVDLSQVVAWKNGFFSFNDASIQTIMKQFANWYDIDVSYQGKMSDARYSGKVQRNMSLQKVLEVLSFTDIKIKLSARKVMVSAQ